MHLDAADLADRFGFRLRLRLRLRRTLQVRDGRTVAQVQDGAGRRFTMKADVEVGAFEGDVAAIETLRAAGLPVARVVSYRTGPPAVVIMSWVDGDPLSSAAPLSAQRAAGRVLRAVHALPGGPPFSGQRSVVGWITAWTGEVAHWWPSVGGTAEQVARLWAWLGDLTPVLAGRAGTLTLFDGRAEHFLVGGGDVVGLIDLHDLGSGDPAMDLAVLALTDEELLPGVIEGYAADGRELEELTRLVPFFLLLRRLAGAEWHLRLGDPAEGRELLRLAAATGSVVGRSS